MASQQHGVQARTGVTDAEADRAAWTVVDEVSDRSDLDDRTEFPDSVGGDGSEGRDPQPGHAKVGGARAVGLALEVGRDATWPTLAWRVPGLPWLLDRVYALIAANRHRLPGETPWCAANPGACATPAP